MADLHERQHIEPLQDCLSGFPFQVWIMLLDAQMPHVSRTPSQLFVSHPASLPDMCHQLTPLTWTAVVAPLLLLCSSQSGPSVNPAVPGRGPSLHELDRESSTIPKG